MNQKKLHDKILEAANIINNANRKGSDNYIITSSSFMYLYEEAILNIEKYKKRKRIIEKLLN